jgi:hypothetical protein
MQNAASAGAVAPHEEHVRASGDAHDMQNFAASGFVVPHPGQFISPHQSSSRFPLR